MQVNAICPGWVDTDMAWQGIDEIVAATGADARGGGRRGDARRAARPDGRSRTEIAGTVAWLLSPDARGVTGQAIDQNGGAWMG